MPNNTGICWRHYTITEKVEGEVFTEYSVFLIPGQLKLHEVDGISPSCAKYIIFLSDYIQNSW